MSRSPAPIALRMPISRVRSVTAIVIVLTMEIAPTMRATSAAPKMIASKSRVVDSMSASVERGSRASRPVKKRMRRARSAVFVLRSTSTISAEAGVAGRRASVGGTSWRNNACEEAYGTITAASKIVNDFAIVPTT